MGYWSDRKTLRALRDRKRFVATDAGCEARQRRVSGERVGDLAIAYGVSQSVMSRAIAGVTWSHV
jgi:DNA-binding transcriptional ArsR family regulator